ncbi:hypothetical protein OH77DRAFT_1419819, partial [Trametes cingulata]
MSASYPPGALHVRLADLEEYFSQRYVLTVPTLFSPLPPRVSDTFPMSGLLNAHMSRMRLIPPSVLGPIEHPTTDKENDRIPLFIQFPTHMPTHTTPWVLDPAETPTRGFTVSNVVFVPLLGPGRILAIIEHTTTTAKLVISPFLCPSDRIYVAVPRYLVSDGDIATTPLRDAMLDVVSQGSRMLAAETPSATAQGIWPRLKRAISSQFTVKSPPSSRNV